MHAEDFALRLRDGVAARAGEGETSFEEAFVIEMIELLTRAGECEQPAPCLHESFGVKVSAYDLRDDCGTVDLYSATYDNLDTLKRIESVKVRQAFERMQRFFRNARSGLAERLDPAFAGHDLAKRIKRLKSVQHVRCIFITNGTLPRMGQRIDEEDGIRFSFHAWGLPELYRMAMEDRPPEDFEVHFHGPDGVEGIPAVALPTAPGALESYLAVIPASLLKELYDTHGLRLLESNVRTFLRNRGKVNRGILQSVKLEPAMFFAYNNGITATVTDIEVRKFGRDACRLLSGRNLQIVNGGQTTASLHYAAVQQKVSLDGIFVQMKLSRVDQNAAAQSMVRRISRYANTQNRVQPSDLEANHPFHIRLEQLSRAVWAPVGLVEGGTRGRWFFERARGEYDNELARHKTPAQQRTFKRQNPKAQRMVKTDVAKYINTWGKLPYLVAFGGEKNFAAMMSRLEEAGPELPDEMWFKDLVAKAIIFKGCDRVVRQSGVQGQKSKIVPYSVAWLADLSKGSFDLQRVWREQRIGSDLEAWFSQATEQVRQHLFATAVATTDVGEWAKKEECWRMLLGSQDAPPVPESCLVGETLQASDASDENSPWP